MSDINARISNRIYGTLRVRLLEDLHSGTGIGKRGGADDALARDGHGVPILPFTMVRGDLKDAAARLAAIHPQKYPLERVASLFNDSDRPSGHRMVLDDLAPENPESVQVRTYRQTAIDADSETALPHALRSVEVIERGAVFVGSVAISDSESMGLLTDAARFLRALGGDRTRGLGAVDVSIEWTPRVCSAGRCAEALSTIQRLPEDTQWIRIRIRATAVQVLSFLSSEQAAFTLRTLGYIPGAALWGALAEKLTQTSDRDTDEHLNCMLQGKGMSVGDLLPLPLDAEAIEGSVETPIPAPLTMRRPKRSKPQSGEGELATFAWATSNSANRSNAMPAIDELISSASDLALAETSAGPPVTWKPKPLSRGSYLWRCENGADEAKWICYQPRIEVRTRTAQSPQNRASKETDGLFAHEHLSARQQFAGEITIWGVGTRDRAKAFLHWITPWIDGEPIELGRGKRWVALQVVVDETPPQAGANPLPDAANQLFTISLTSSMCLRSTYGTFFRAIENEGFREALIRTSNRLGLSKEVEQALGSVEVVTSKSRTLTNRGMHYSGMPSFSRVLLEPGSCALIRIKSSVDYTTLSQALAKAGAIGVGEDTARGHGRFLVNHAIHAGRPRQPQQEILLHSARSLRIQEEERRIQLAQRRSNIWERVDEVRSGWEASGAAALSPSKWGALWAFVECYRGSNICIDLLNHLRERSGKESGRSLDTLRAEIEKLASPEWSELEKRDILSWALRNMRRGAQRNSTGTPIEEAAR